MRHDIRFLLGSEERRISGADPTRSVLDYLREDEQLHGTKEGCAEGDCGACTVLLAERTADGGLRRRPVNACIMFLPALDGKQVMTVEHLAGPDGRLHPVQQAMLDHHASQCGFCTPGFVMSLTALYEERASPGAGLPDRPAIADALAGNLCRCTGYRPILDAAAAALAQPQAQAQAGDAIAARLAALGTEAATLACGTAARRFMAPRSLGELTALLAAMPEALLLGGGTDVALWVTKQQRDLPLLIATGAVAEMLEIAEDGAALRIGGAVAYADAAAALARLAPAAAGLIRRIGSRQIRERGTIGGNIANASPIGDMPPPLIALGASLLLVSASGRRRLPIAEFFLDYRRTALLPGEVIAAIEIPRPAPALRLGVYKVSKRFDQDISAVCAAFAIRLEGGTVAEARLAYGGMAAIPRRAAAAEAALLGAPWTEASLEAATEAMAADFTPLSDMRASAAYRAQVARNLLRKFFLEHPAEGAAPPPLRLDQPLQEAWA
ncbi:xanthine dehydrogenase small subunit [Acidisoma sp. C75]